MFMVINLVRRVSYHEEFPTKHSNDSSLRWSCEITWQIRYIISPLAEAHGHQIKQNADLQ